ncbi:cell division/GTP binding protein [Rhizopus microsporus var. microsporus]|uniref:Cell division/GTP binding protein n=2 Tax=Rhizopus microsporus TaxID=58291 RepID=A0A2G4SLU3_RHIZD|nr:cell division/GTP binding protein [Rhizopus microsporus ATCC 52813]ORE08232.1 cell division/GTP binding protein [Rhizopus microsporus var. microsporus]PHZ09729.1 cell division/GTP binding protein [Rhizopus microsporus ATCC 52813]
MLYSQKLSQNARAKKDNVTYLNIMVVGMSDFGKTSFIRTFCEALKQDMIQGTYKESKHKALKGPVQLTEELYTISMQIEQDGKRIALTFIDTPGLTSSPTVADQLKYITKYVDHQFARTLAEESKVRRDAKALDTHIHACLYFMGASCIQGLTDVDRFILKVLSARTNVIPVIGKADTLTTAQTEKLKKTIKKDIFDTHRIPVYGYIEEENDGDDDHDEDDDDDSVSEEENSYLSRTINFLMECVEEDKDEDAHAMLEYLHAMPFTVIGYEEDLESGRPIQLLPGEASSQPSSAVSLTDPGYYSESIGSIASSEISPNSSKSSIVSHGMGSTKHLLGRRYPWGVVDCYNPSHSDFLLIKKVLLKTHREMLRIDTFECFYEKYRTQQLMEKPSLV